jgi:hypothetical protein
MHLERHDIWDGPACKRAVGMKRCDVAETQHGLSVPRPRKKSANGLYAAEIVVEAFVDVLRRKSWKAS